MSVLMIGSSHVNRLERYLYEQFPGCNPFRLEGAVCDVNFCGVSGGRIASSSNVRTWEDSIGRHKPGSVIVQLGGNDLDSESPDDVCVDAVVFRLVSLMSMYAGKFMLNRVYVNQLLPRYQTRRVPVNDYNDMVVASNRLLKAELSGNPVLTYWKLHGLKHCDLFHDGVHLTQKGMANYYKNIRGAVLQHCRCGPSLL